MQRPMLLALVSLFSLHDASLFVALSLTSLSLSFCLSLCLSFWPGSLPENGLFRVSSLPQSFMTEMRTISETFTRHFTSAIERNLDLDKNGKGRVEDQVCKGILQLNFATADTHDYFLSFSVSR
jgi:hypothetical protein